MSSPSHCTQREHSSELGSRMKSTMIWLRQNHSVVHGPRNRADSAARNKELLSPERLELSHHTRLSGLAAREEFQPGGHAWEWREQIGKEAQKGRTLLQRALHGQRYGFQSTEGGLMAPRLSLLCPSWRCSSWHLFHPESPKQKR